VEGVGGGVPLRKEVQTDEREENERNGQREGIVASREDGVRAPMQLHGRDGHTIHTYAWP
jgi:hypothetical protein